MSEPCPTELTYTARVCLTHPAGPPTRSHVFLIPMLSLTLALLCLHLALDGACDPLCGLTQRVPPRGLPPQLQASVSIINKSSSFLQQGGQHLHFLKPRLTFRFFCPRFFFSLQPLAFSPAEEPFCVTVSSFIYFYAPPTPATGSNCSHPMSALTSNFPGS